MTRYEPRNAVISGGENKGDVEISDDAIIVSTSVIDPMPGKETYRIEVYWLAPVPQSSPLSETDFGEDTE